MSVKIRFQQVGKPGQRSYRIVVMDGRAAQSSAALDQVGTYNPAGKDAASRISYNPEKLASWIAKGAQMNDTVKVELQKAGYRAVVAPKAPAAKKKEPTRHDKKRYKPVAKRVKKEKKPVVAAVPKKKKKDAKK